MTKTFTPAELVAILRDRGIIADDCIQAAAGPDYGHVEAWAIGKAGYVIAYGKAPADYDVIEDCEDLRAWLIHPDLDSESAAIEVANVDGEIEPCDDDATDVAVMIMRSWYGPSTTADLARSDDGRADVLRFATVADAQVWIDDLDGFGHVLAHNECSGPGYVIVQA